jgi:y4mF family transcriptional regulator
MDDTDFLDQLATAVRTVRRRQGMDQSELAMAAGVSTRTVHRVENAHPTMRIDSALKVLEALGIALRLDEPDGE